MHNPDPKLYLNIISKVKLHILSPKSTDVTTPDSVWGNTKDWLRLERWGDEGGVGDAVMELQGAVS